MISTRQTMREAIAERLRALRSARSLSAAEVTAALQLSRSTYQGWERGEGAVPSDVLPDLAEFFGVSVDYLLRPPGAAMVWSVNQQRVDELLHTTSADAALWDEPWGFRVDSCVRTVRTESELLEVDATLKEHRVKVSVES